MSPGELSARAQSIAAAACRVKLPALVALLLLQLIVTGVVLFFSWRALKAMQAAMVSIDDDHGFYPDAAGGFGAFGGFGGPGYAPDRPSDWDGGSLGGNADSEDVALQHALAASAAEANGGGVGAHAGGGGVSAAEDAELQQAMAASVAEAGVGADANSEDLALQEALRQSREEEELRRQRAAEAAEARARQ